MTIGQVNVQDWDSEYDVIVVGSGAGAMAGAFSAASRGLKTLVVEKTPFLGGTSSYSGASCWLPATQVQERAGVADSVDAARAYLQSLLGETEADRREAFLASAPELVKALEHDPAIEFRWTAFPDYFAGPGRMDAGRSMMPLDLPRSEIGDLAALVRPNIESDRRAEPHPDGPLTAGQALIGRLLLGFMNTGNGSVRTETEMTGLIVEEGRAAGISVETAEGPHTLRAAAGVLLGAGGFESNAGMRTHNGTPGSADWSMAPQGSNTGTAIRSAQEAGAAVELMEEGWWCPGVLQPSGDSAFTLGFRGGLMVSGDGRRFANESLPYDRMGRQMAFAAEDRIPSWFVFDSRFGGGLPAIMRPDITSPREHLDAGTWVQAQTLEELAERTGLPAEALSETVHRFNSFAESGVDEDFHRGEDPYDLFFTDPSHGPNPALVALDQPPYFAARMVLSDLGTKGGLRTDPDARVLSEDGEPIPGLYAVGNTSASFSGRFYPGPGIPIGTAMVFAYRAVQSMAAS
ncbi:FAD-binding protein [Arthrobacter sp. APC 3897]|uniref:FAD-binding protein n=1 Tax=Arthrobacter sp. APC 3897 TaxID=3035204 RepID=UPI0025B52449|nr:FAD-binding protein [Arthrobacter sp. APC 3897]MDN3480896.1 FAD-binding protein [Arthrobacter sp. APC 3897]